MAKILISPLGVGGRFKKSDTFDREYQEATYQIGDRKFAPSRFVAAVLYEHYQLDGIIFIGTVKSMWEEVYRYFCEKNGRIMDESYWLALAEKIDSLNHESPLESLDLLPIQEVLGERSECILIKYGLDQTELWENFDAIIQIVDRLKPQDELYIDITHSFRSLSLFLFLVVTFLQDLASEKQIRIAGVFYGMLDVTREIGYAPVVDLQPLFDMTAWIKGAYSLKTYGDGDAIAQLLKAQGETQIAEQIHQLSSAININYLPEIKHRIAPLNSSLKISRKGPFKYLSQVLEGFVHRFTTKTDVESRFQLKLAGWYFENKRYATGYITLTEAIITYLCEQYGKDPRSETDRNTVKGYLMERENKTSELAQLYFKVNAIRKGVAHALLEGKTESPAGATKNARKYYKQAEELIGR